MKHSLSQIIAISGLQLIIFTCSAQVRSSNLFHFIPTNYIIELAEKESGNKKIKIDSLELVDKKFDSTLIYIYNLLPSTSIWKHYYITIGKSNDSSIVFEIAGWYSNELLFEQHNYSIYGFFHHFGRKIYVRLYNSNPKDIELFFKKSDKSTYIIRDEADSLLNVVNYHEPMWYYKYKNNELKFIKSANVEYYIKK